MPTSSLGSDYTQAIARFLQAHPTLGQGNPFAYQLLSAFQHHLPLTFFQDLFLFVLVFFPGPVAWKLAVFSWFGNLPGLLVPGLSVLIMSGLVFVAWHIARRVMHQKFIQHDPMVFLAVTFPVSASKSAFATEQFMTILHALARQRRLRHRLLGHKKQYALEINASRETGIQYVLGVPKGDASIIEKSLLSYLPGVKITPIADELENLQRTTEHTLGVIELRLTQDYALPLQTQKVLTEHDSIAYLTGHMTKLQPGERLVFQVVATPIMRATHWGVTNRLTQLRQRIHTNQPLAEVLFQTPLHPIVTVPLAILKSLAMLVQWCLVFVSSIVIAFWDTKGDSVPFLQKDNPRDHGEMIVSPYETELQDSVKAKIDQPLFETSVRLLVVANDPIAYQERVAGFLASLASLSNVYQGLVLKPSLPIVGHKLSVSGFLNRRLTGWHNPILSTSELTDIYHFPYTDTTKTEDLIKSKSPHLPAPLHLKQAHVGLDTVFATNSYGGSETTVGLSLEERRRHMYVLGATGSGKTTLLATMIYQDMCAGKGVCVIDPHGQLVEQLLRVIPKERINDVVWFAPDDDAYPIALNLLDLPSSDGLLSPSQLQKQKSLVSSSLISIFQKYYDAKYFGPRMEYVLRNAILTALETPSPTLLTIQDLLTKTSYRKAVVKGLANPILKDFWVNEFEKLGSLQRNQVVSPITNKIGGLLSSPINYSILTQPKSKLDFDEVMKSGKILLCDLSKGKIGEDETSFFGSLIIAKIQLAALRRALIPESERQDFYLYVDEFQNFATTTFAELVSEARKYRLAAILAHQSISQIENRDVVKIILANVGTVMCFKTANPEDEQFILPIFSPEVAKHNIANLPLYHFYMKIAVGQAHDAFVVQVNNFTVKGTDHTARAVMDASRLRYATPVENLVAGKEIRGTEVRQAIAYNVSHLTRLPETEIKMFAGSKADNFSSYPIHKRSKVGNGSMRNNNTHNSSPNTPIIPTPPITPQQQHILFLLYRFRFLNRTQIQHLLYHKNHKRILVWLNDLTNKIFIQPIDPLPVTNTSKAMIYYLTKKSIQFLGAQDHSNKPFLQKFYRENKRSPAFISQCQFLTDLYLSLQQATTETDGYTMYVKSDYPILEFKELLSDLNPDSFIIEEKSEGNQLFFLELLKNDPFPRLRQRLKRYTSFYESNEWESMTGQEFPTVLIVAPDNQIKTYVAQYLKKKIKELDLESLHIRLTTRNEVIESGLMGKIWEDLG